MIVDNGGAAKENDTYRRGVKIVRYFQAHWGDRNLALFDWHHLEQSINGLAISSITQPASQPTSQLNRSGFGGETTSIPIFNFISQCLIESGLTCKQNHVPDGIMEEAEIFHLLKERIEIRDPEAAIYTGKAFRRTPESKHLDICRSVRDCRYLPRLDLVAGFHAPRSFHQWLQRLASLLREDVANYSFLFAQQGREQSRFVNLISVEIETTISKHAHGGILNIANHSYCGIWAAPSLAKSHLKFMKNRFGLQNVVYFPVDQWIKKG